MTRAAMMSSVALGVLLASTAAIAAEPAPETNQALTLDQAQHLALSNHPLLQQAHFDVDAALQAIAVARSAYFPQVSAAANRVFAPNNTRIAANPGITSPTVIDHASIGVGVSQLITDFGRTSDEVARAKLQAASEADVASQTEQSVLLSVTEAYYDVLGANARLKVAQENLQDRTTILKRVSALEQARLRSGLDVSVAQQVVDEANLFLLSARGDRDAAIAGLSEALGTRAGSTYTLADAGDAAFPPPDAERLVDAMIETNPQLAAARASRDAAYKNADAAGDAYMPTVSATGYAGYSPIDNVGQHIRDSYEAGGISVTIPLYTGGMLRASENQARDQAEAADRQVADTENRLSHDIRAAYAAVRTAYEDIDVTGHLLDTSRKSLELMRAGFDIGRNSIVDLSQAELQETQAEISHSDARYSYLSKLAALQAIVGDLRTTDSPS